MKEKTKIRLRGFLLLLIGAGSIVGSAYYPQFSPVIMHGGKEISEWIKGEGPPKPEEISHIVGDIKEIDLKNDVTDADENKKNIAGQNNSQKKKKKKKGGEEDGRGSDSDREDAILEGPTPDGSR